MGTIAQKGQYLEDTKGLIKESINNLGGSITSETTFREYAEELDTIYSNLPKVTGENTEVTLNPTLKGKLGIVEKGNSTQETTTGKNLFNLEELSGGVISNKTNTGFTFTRTSYDRFSNAIQLPKTITNNSVIYISADLSNNQFSGQIQLQYGTDSTFTSQTTSVLNGAKRVNIDANYVRIFVPSAETVGASCIINNLQIEISDTKTDYEQYTGGIPSPNPNYPFPIKSVTGNNNVVVKGANLYKPTLKVNNTNITAIRGTVTLTDDEYTFVASGTDMYFGNVTAEGQSYSEATGEKINVSGASSIRLLVTNTNFTNHYITAFNSSNVSLGYSHISVNNVVYNLPANTEYVVIRIGNGSAVSGTTYKTKVMVTLDTTITTYVPYANQTLPLNLGNIELNKIGNYQDYIYKNNDKWYKKEIIKKAVLNGTEDWKYQTGNPNFFFLPKGTYDQQNGGVCMSNQYQAKPVASGNNTMVLGNAYFVLIRDDRYTDVSSYKSWLSSNTLIVYYQLGTSQDIEITDTQLIEQLEEIDKMQGYNGTTIITSTYDSNNAQMILQVSGLKGE